MSHSAALLQLCTCLKQVSPCPSQKTVVHRSYNPTTKAYDIALLVLDRAANTQPAALAPANFKFPTGDNVEYLFAAGWGETEYGSTSSDLK